MERFCCTECFGDRGLRDDIIPSLDPMRGICSFCSSEDVLLVPPRSLADWFELLINVYEQDAQGQPLVQLLKDDWKLFSHPRMDLANAKDLLADILDNGEIVRKSFSPSPSYKSERLVVWETLRDELMYKNRYFLDIGLDSDRLSELLDHISAGSLPSKWFRARIVVGAQSYSIDLMGAPPKHLATHGRANPPGIPYLYLSSLPETAVAELRPHTGEVACVAEFILSPSVNRLIDLRNPRELVSPFLLGSANAIGQLRSDIPFLERLGEELTRPVLPQAAAIEYLPSQYLCEFIKKSGWDGVIYRSSVSDGMNLALFEPKNAEAISVEVYNVSRVSVAVEQAAKRS